ncbi:MAG: hypothetical protein HYR85_03865 [Planctomycetes bacterium]|nr:hypothetical protein [Planctomycetota bacterium]MBI3848491.1 hypothetical protein [Planctomycetota bacterium]
MKVDVDKVLKRTLNLKRLKLPKTPPIVELRYEVGVDWSGDDAVWIWTIVDDSTPKKDWTFAKLTPVYEKIREAVRGTGLEIIPYVRVRSRSGQDAIDAGKV